MESGSSFHNIARQVREFQQEKKLLHRTDVVVHLCHPHLCSCFLLPMLICVTK